MFELILVDERGETALQRLSASPVYIGRASNNDIVLNDTTVSSRHVAVWAVSDRVFVEDLRSRNGTFINERPVRGVGRMTEGQTLRLGTTMRLTVRELPMDNSPATGSPFLIEDIDNGISYPIRSDRVQIGGTGADVPTQDGVEDSATLLVDDGGEIFLGIEDDLHDVVVDKPFEVGGRRFRVRQTQVHVSVTRDVASTKYPYSLNATLDSGTGPSATLHNGESDLRYIIEAENRAILLYLLARQVVDDDEAGKSSDERGWCYDEDLITGIWGRTSASEQTNNLSVLLCRTRGELRKAGFDPWFIERRKRNIRARVASARVV